MEVEKVLDSVKEYYGKKLSCSADLKTQSCVVPGKVVTKATRQAIGDVHEEVANRYYGCGLAIPNKLEGMKVLDLGSGSGRDCYALSKLVGPEGHVTGVDMTNEQVEVANKYITYHTEKFGYDVANVKFLKGYIEKLTEIGIQENSLDILISNCTINLTPDKRAVIAEAYKVLKVGGELYFSDIYTDTDLPESIRKNKVLWGEGFSGALLWKDLYSFAEEVGFSTPRLVSATSVPVDRDDFKKIIGDAKYASVTYRLFKLPSDRQEGGQQVIYKGRITDCEDELVIDHQNIFKTGDVVQVDTELATILCSSRFHDEFDFQPVSKNNKEGTNGCCPAQTQRVDPFVYLVDKEKKGETVISSCCGGPKQTLNR